MTVSKESLQKRTPEQEAAAQRELQSFVAELEERHGANVTGKAPPKGIDKAALASQAVIPVPPVAKEPYTHEAMIQLMIEHPDYSHSQLAGHFGRNPSFVSSVLASDAFQLALEPHRHKVADPALAASLEERFRSLAIRATTVLHDRLNNANADPALVLKAAEISIKALGATAFPPPDPLAGKDMRTPAQKILDAMDARDAANAARTLEATTPFREVKDVTPGSNS